MSEWEGKLALVTGGSRGIGRAIAAALVERGVRVVLTGRSEERARATAEELGSRAQGLAMDVSDRETVIRVIQSVFDEHERIDILVNNAGITRDNLLMRMKPEEWDAVLTTNVNALYYCSQAVLRPMIRQRSGRVINMSSVVGLTGNAGQVNYAASKAAILGFTKALAREVASRNVTVNAIAPGYIDTDMTRELPQGATEALHEAIPMKRIGQPSDVAAAVLYLASEGASYVTGQVLQVNGGLYM
ncbi:MAG: 3-oxoacyl-ACP reductase FabG [Acidobacteria bacterium]|nr:MAG: 3-oxoacyl-ACP reductase FabG [Acidobacteriota bacterium]